MPGVRRRWRRRARLGDAHPPALRPLKAPSSDPSGALKALVAVAAALLWAALAPTTARAHEVAPLPSPRPLPPLPSPLPPSLDACPAAAASGSSSSTRREIFLTSSNSNTNNAVTPSQQQQQAAADAATARLDALLDGGGMGRPTAASVLAFVRERATGPRPITSGVLFAVTASLFLLFIVWRIVGRLQAVFRACSAPPIVYLLPGASGGGPNDARAALACKAAAARHRATNAPLAVTARLFITAAAATGAAFAILGAVGAANSRLAPALFERADAAAAVISDAAARAEDARSALLSASASAGNLSLAISGASTAMAAAQAQAEAAAAAAAAALLVPAAAAPPAAAIPSFDGAGAQQQLEQLRSGLQSAATGLDPLLSTVRDRLLPLLLAPSPSPPTPAAAVNATTDPPVRQRWWRQPVFSAENWRAVAAALDGWRRRGEIGLFSALAAAPCLLSLMAWAGWRPGVGFGVGVSLWLSALAGLLAVVFALLNVVLADACPASEALALRFAPQTLQPVLGYYFGASGGGGGNAAALLASSSSSSSLSSPPPVALDPLGIGLAAALEESGVLGAGAAPLLQQLFAGAEEAGAGGSSSNTTALSLTLATAAASLDAALNASLAALPPAIASSSNSSLTDAAATLSDAGQHMAAAADAVMAELRGLLAALSRDRVLGPLYAAPKALLCCAVSALARAAWLALTGAGAGALAEALFAVPLLRRLDVAAVAAAAAGWGGWCLGGGCGGGGGSSGIGSGGGGVMAGGVNSDKQTRALEARVAELEAARMARLRALEDAAEAAAAARRAAWAGGPLM